MVYSHQSLAEERLLAPWPRLEGSYNIGSIYPSFHLPVSFLGIGSLVFSETYHNVRGPYMVLCDSRIFWKKNPSGKNGQRWPKNMVFGLFKKIMSLVFCLEKSDSQVIAKNGSWPMRFQYSLIVNISLID